MSKELVLIPVGGLTAFQVMQIMSGRSIRAISTETIGDDDFMILLVDRDFRHRLPFVENTAAYDEYFHGQLKFNTPLSDTQIKAIDDALIKNYSADRPFRLHDVLRGH